MDKTEFMHWVWESHGEYESALTGLNEAHIQQAGACGSWSVRDLIAHVTWYEREMVQLLQTHVLAGSKLWDLTSEQRNEAIRAAIMDRPLTEVVTEATLVHKTLGTLLEAMSDEDFVDPGNFRDMPSDWVPWQLLVDNTFEHYRTHAGDIRAAFGKHEDG